MEVFPVKKWLSLILTVALLALPAAALADEVGGGEIVPAMEMSLEEYAKTHSFGEPDENARIVAMEPYAPVELQKAVIGPDDRLVVDEPGVYPYSAIARLEMHMKCGCGGTGTGFMIGPTSMMTAAHCLICTDHGQGVDRLTMYFGYKSDKNYLYKSEKWSTYWYGTDFHNSDGTFSYNGEDHVEWDYAYIKLSERVGDRVGWFGVMTQTNSDLENGWYEVAGYRRGVLRTDSDRANAKNQYLLNHHADMEPGNSGCPVFTIDNYAIAVNIAENSFLQQNIGRRITSELIDRMRENGMFEK